MSLRKKACSSCVAAKRKCDSAFPACHRCVQRSLTCRYPYPLPQSYQESHQDDFEQEDMIRSSLVAVGDLQTPSTSGLSATGSWSIEESLFASQASPMFSEHLISSDESTLDGIIAPYRTEPKHGHSEHGTHWHVSFDRRILEFYPRVDDKETWAYGVKTLLNQVDIFLHTGSAFFIKSEAHTGNGLLPRLRAAYGVCSSFRVRTESQFPFYQQLLENEVEDSFSPRSSDTLQYQVAELCAMLLYYIIIHFGGAVHRGRLVDKSAQLLAQHTTRVESLELATRQSTETLLQAELLSQEEGLELWQLCENARKVVMVSYLAREIRHVLRYKTCYLLRQIVALPVSKKLIRPPVGDFNTGDAMRGQWRDIVSYDGFVRDWEAGELVVADDFTRFLISTCKGIRAL